LFLAIEKLSQASVHEEFKKIADQINLLEAMISEYDKKIKTLQRHKAALKDSVKQLKARRRELIFIGIHVKE